MSRTFHSLERIWRHTVAYPILRILLHNPKVELPLNLSQVRSVLILRYDKIGDMVVTLPVFRILKTRNPRLKIGVLASEVNCELAAGNRNIDDLFILPRNPISQLKLLWRIRKQRYDVVLDFIFNRMSSGGLVCNLAGSGATKIGMGPAPYGFYFNVLLSIPRGTTPMVEMLIEFVAQVFGIDVPREERALGLEISTTAKSKVDEFLGRHRLSRRRQGLDDLSYVVFNVSAGQPNKRLREGQIFGILSALGRRLDLRTVVIASPEDGRMARAVVARSESLNSLFFPDSGQSNLNEVASLLEGAIATVTPDTAIVHIASAVSTPVFGVFTPLQVTDEWLPHKVPYKLVVAPEGKPASAIELSVLEEGMNEFLRELRNGSGERNVKQ